MTVLGVILWVCIWILEVQVGASLARNMRREKFHSGLPFKIAELLQETVFCLYMVTSHAHRIHFWCSAKWNLKLQPPTKTLPALQPLRSSFLAASNGELPHHFAQRRLRGGGGGRLHAFTPCVYLLWTLILLWKSQRGGRRHAGEKKTPMELHLLPGSGQPPSVSKKKPVMGVTTNSYARAWKRKSVLGTCQLNTSVLLGTRKFDLRRQMATNQRLLSSLDSGKISKDSEGQRRTQQSSMHSISKAEKQKGIWEAHTPQPILAGDAPNLIPGP